jgi:hypothetical protein
MAYRPRAEYNSEGPAMKRPARRSVFAALCFATASAAAQGISGLEYRAILDTISADFKAATTACSIESGNAKDICSAKANGRRDIALAELQERRQPGSKAAYEVAVTKAKAAYAIARERCDDLSYGDGKACQTEIRATEASALSEARAALSKRTPR